MTVNDQTKAYRQNAPQDSGYSAMPQAGSPTYTEAWALIESARRMAVCIQNGISDEPKDRRGLRDALRLNWRLWTIFQSELSIMEDATIPEDIRVNMLTLCGFVDRHTVDTMSEPTPEKVVALIDMNRNIASGLLASLESSKAEGETAQPTQPAAPTPAPQEKTEPSAEAETPPLTSIDHEV